MPIKLTKLKTSLTKHGAYKIAELLRDYPAGDLFDAIEGTGLDPAQARKNLSVGRSGDVPEAWERARALGGDAIDALVLVGVVFTHHLLIRAMREGRRGRMRGSIARDAFDDEKVFTNLKGMLGELRFTTRDSPEKVDYDLSRLLLIEGLAPLVFDLLQRKLRTAGWDESTDALDEMVAQGFHQALAMSEPAFRQWLDASDQPALATDDDEDFFSGADAAPTQPFAFAPGHTPRKTGRVARAKSSAGTDAELLHNEVQTAFYKNLVRRYGNGAVRTEQPTGLGTSVDIVVQRRGRRVFYEIKIAASVRACIRQALPQLMEYAYWRCTDDLAGRLVVVGLHPLTAESRAYLAYLREQFGIPVWYKRFILRRLGR